MKTYEQMTDSVLIRADKIIKQKQRQRKAVVNTSVAAALVAALSAGIWVIQDDRGDNTSTPVLQNPSQDNPAITPPVTEASKMPPIIDESTAPLPPEIDTSTPEIDWDLIRLEAVYEEVKGDIIDAIEFKVAGSYFEAWCDSPLAEPLNKNSVYAVQFATYVKGYDEYDLENEIWQKLYEENKDIITEYERIIESREKGWYQVQQEQYFPLLKSMHEEAKQIAEANANEEKGREILFADLEKIGIKVFTRDIDLIYTDENGENLGPAKHKTFHIAYLTVDDIKTLREYIEGSDEYGVWIKLAPEYLKQEGDVCYQKCIGGYYIEEA